MIKFGTDGWRGLIANDSTFDNVRRAGGGIASYVLRHENPRTWRLRRLRHPLFFNRPPGVAAETIAEAGIPYGLQKILFRRRRYLWW